MLTWVYDERGGIPSNGTLVICSLHYSVTNIPIITASSPEPGEVEYQHPIPCRIQLLIFDFSPRKNSTLQKRNQSNGEQSTMRMLPQKGVRPRSFLAGCYKALNLKLFVIATAHTARYPLEYWCRICSVEFLTRTA